MSDPPNDSVPAADVDVAPDPERRGASLSPESSSDPIEVAAAARSCQAILFVLAVLGVLLCIAGVTIVGA